MLTIYFSTNLDTPGTQIVNKSYFFMLDKYCFHAETCNTTLIVVMKVSVTIWDSTFKIWRKFWPLFTFSKFHKHGNYFCMANSMVQNIIWNLWIILDVYNSTLWNNINIKSKFQQFNIFFKYTGISTAWIPILCQKSILTQNWR